MNAEERRVVRFPVLCRLIGHSCGFNLRVLVTRKDAKCRVAVFCTRCGRPMPKRLKKAVFQYPYHHPGQRPNDNQALPREESTEVSET